VYFGRDDARSRIVRIQGSPSPTAQRAAAQMQARPECGRPHNAVRLRQPGVMIVAVGLIRPIGYGGQRVDLDAAS
jgi:hypothetical protein